MYCSNRGTKIEEKSKFCHSCGSNILKETDRVSKKIDSVKKENETPKEPNKKQVETRETYMAKTCIKNFDEAKKYLNQLRVLFWLVFLTMVIIRGLGVAESELATILFYPYIALLIYFIYFCAKVLKVEKLSRANAILCVVFAPLSWLYLYPLIAVEKKVPGTFFRYGMIVR